MGTINKADRSVAGHGTGQAGVLGARQIGVLRARETRVLWSEAD